MWTELAERLYRNIRVRAGASDAALAAAGRAVGTELPAELRSLLAESNGIVTEDGLNLVWPVERIVDDNVRLRSESADLYMPFEPLLFFADAGNGDQFAFVVIAGAVQRPDVFAWNHEDDSRAWVAPDLRRYLEWWADGRITL